MQYGYTALIKSAGHGNVEAAQLLLESKADIHAATQVPQAAQAMRTKPANLLRLRWLCFLVPPSPLPPPLPRPPPPL